MLNNKSSNINSLTKKFSLYFWDPLKMDFMDMPNEVGKVTTICVLFKNGTNS